MRTIITIHCAFFLLFLFSCNEPRVGSTVDTTEAAELVESLSTSNRVEFSTGEDKTQLCKWCSDKDLLITFLYVIVLIFSCLYYKHTGKHHDTLEENLAILSKKIAWKHRILLFIAAWIHGKIKNKTQEVKEEHDDNK